MGRLSYRQTDEMGTPVRHVSAGFGPLLTGCWRLLGLLVMTALAWACGSESVCPAGTSGSTCIPTDDLGAAPDVPMSSRDRDIEDASEADVPEGGASDVDASVPDTTQWILREAPGALRPNLPRPWERGGWVAANSGHTTEHERVAECAALTGNHVDPRGAPAWRALDHVDRGGGPVRWRYAA